MLSGAGVGAARGAAGGGPHSSTLKTYSRVSHLAGVAERQERVTRALVVGQLHCGGDTAERKKKKGCMRS